MSMSVFISLASSLHANRITGIKTVSTVSQMDSVLLLANMQNGENPHSRRPQTLKLSRTLPPTFVRANHSLHPHNNKVTFNDVVLHLSPPKPPSKLPIQPTPRRPISRRPRVLWMWRRGIGKRARWFGRLRKQ